MNTLLRHAALAALTALALVACEEPPAAGPPLDGSGAMLEGSGDTLAAAAEAQAQAKAGFGTAPGPWYRLWNNSCFTARMAYENAYDSWNVCMQRELRDDISIYGAAEGDEDEEERICAYQAERVQDAYCNMMSVCTFSTPDGC